MELNQSYIPQLVRKQIESQVMAGEKNELIIITGREHPTKSLLVLNCI
jgi:hypothetical protein